MIPSVCSNFIHLRRTLQYETVWRSTITAYYIECHFTFAIVVVHFDIHQATKNILRHKSCELLQVYPLQTYFLMILEIYNLYTLSWMMLFEYILNMIICINLVQQIFSPWKYIFILLKNYVLGFAITWTHGGNISLL
jgi:hypothetical protein